MKPENKIKPSELRREARELLRTNRMPKLDPLLEAVAEVRTKYRDAIKRARERKS